MTPPLAGSHVSSSGSSSVFDRLYSKSTESQRMRRAAAPDAVVPKIFVPRDDGESDGSKKNLPKNRYKTAAKPKEVRARTTTTATTGTSGGVYERLYSKGTASYSAKRKDGKDEGDGPSTKSTGRRPLKSKNNA